MIEFLDTKNQFVLCLEEALQTDLAPIAEDEDENRS